MWCAIVNGEIYKQVPLTLSFHQEVEREKIIIMSINYARRFVRLGMETTNLIEGVIFGFYNLDTVICSDNNI